MADPYCARRFSAVRRAFKANFDPKKTEVPDVGASVCIYVDGKLVVDLWQGYLDENRTRPWQRDSQVCIFSSGKAVLALGLHLLVEQGLATYDDPVSKHWPEFSANDKKDITLKQVLSHRAGIPTVEAPMQKGDLFNWQASSNTVAAAPTLWKPDSTHGYHGLTFGIIIGEVIQRITQQKLDDYIQQAIVAPLGIDFSYGAARQDETLADILFAPPHTCMAQYAEQALNCNPKSITNMGDPRILTPPILNSKAWRNACMPGANAHSNARSMARFFSALIQGRLCNPATLKSLQRAESEGIDKVFNAERRWGLGLALSCEPACFGPAGDRDNFGLFGIYGPVGFADVKNKVAFSYCMNQIGEPFDRQRNGRLINALYECL